MRSQLYHILRALAIPALILLSTLHAELLHAQCTWPDVRSAIDKFYDQAGPAIVGDPRHQRSNAGPSSRDIQGIIECLDTSKITSTFPWPARLHTMTTMEAAEQVVLRKECILNLRALDSILHVNVLLIGPRYSAYTTLAAWWNELRQRGDALFIPDTTATRRTLLSLDSLLNRIDGVARQADSLARRTDTVLRLQNSTMKRLDSLRLMIGADSSLPADTTPYNLVARLAVRIAGRVDGIAGTMDALLQIVRLDLMRRRTGDTTPIPCSDACIDSILGSIQRGTLDTALLGEVIRNNMPGSINPPPTKPGSTTLWINGTLYDTVAGIEGVFNPGWLDLSPADPSAFRVLGGGGLYTSGAVRLCVGIECWGVALLGGTVVHPVGGETAYQPSVSLHWLHTPGWLPVSLGATWTNTFGWGVSFTLYRSP